MLGQQERVPLTEMCGVGIHNIKTEAKIYK